MSLVSIPLSALSLRLMDVLPVQSYGRTWFLPQDFRILPRLCFPGGFSFTDGSNVKLVKDEMADITGPDREDVSGRADYDRYGDD